MGKYNSLEKSFRFERKQLILKEKLFFQHTVLINNIIYSEKKMIVFVL